MKKTFVFFTLICLVLAFTTCTEEGPRGPQGAKGADGADGADGQNGFDGQDGKDGNANVITYFITDSASIAWAGDYIRFTYTPGAFEIPDSIIDFGLILVYTQVLGSSASQKLWYAVPGIGYNAMYTTRLFIRHDYLQITAYKPDGSYWTTGTLPRLHAVKIVLVPASTIINLRSSGIHTNFDDYNYTMDILGLSRNE